MKDNPFVSIIIPTYNRAKLLPITIRSFVEQEYPKDRFEIIIVDNNSTDNTSEVVKQFLNLADISINYVFEERQGVHYARNKASKYAKGEILYYTDDDMIADKHLLSEIVKPFTIDPQVASATGKVLPKWEVSPPEWILKLCYNSLLSINDQGEKFEIADYDINVFSCHQAIRKDIFIQSGGFNPENTAGNWIGDGETGLNIKIKQLGYKFAYNGKSIIYHMIPPHRMTQDYLNKRFANQGNCDSYTAYRKNIYPDYILIFHNVYFLMLLSLFFLRFLLKKITTVSFLKTFEDITWRKDRAYVTYYFSRIIYNFKIIKDADFKNLILKYDWINE